MAYNFDYLEFSRLSPDEKRRYLEANRPPGGSSGNTGGDPRPSAPIDPRTGLPYQNAQTRRATYVAPTDPYKDFVANLDPRIVPYMGRINDMLQRGASPHSALAHIKIMLPPHLRNQIPDATWQSAMGAIQNRNQTDSNLNQQVTQGLPSNGMLSDNAPRQRPAWASRVPGFTGYSNPNAPVQQMPQPAAPQSAYTTPAPQTFPAATPSYVSPVSTAIQPERSDRRVGNSAAWQAQRTAWTPQQLQMQSRGMLQP